MAIERKGKVKYKQSLLKPPQQQQQQQLKRKVKPVEDGLNSDETKKQYRWQINAFLKYLGLKEEAELLQLDPHGELEEEVIEYLHEYMSKKKHLKHSTINTAMAAIFHFCVMNDIMLNTKKISRYIPDDEDYKEDRHYTHEEIQQLIETYSDERSRVAILLMTCGLRVGALPELLVGDLEAIEIGEFENQQRVYKIIAYSRSKKHRYYTFCTPECAEAIDKYLAYREGFGEDLTDKVKRKIAPLIREQFNIYDRAAAAKPQKIAVSSIEKIIERAISKTRIGTTGEVMKTNGFRKFAITQMKKAKVDFSDREYLVGHRHSRGLDENYVRTSEKDLLVEWSKAIDLLTINPAFRLKKKLQLIEGQTAQEMAKLKSEIKAQQKERQTIYNMAQENQLWVKEAQAQIKQMQELLDKVGSPEYQDEAKQVIREQILRKNRRNRKKQPSS